LRSTPIASSVMLSVFCVIWPVAMPMIARGFEAPAAASRGAISATGNVSSGKTPMPISIVFVSASESRRVSTG
jgi:hypothetical protein